MIGRSAASVWSSGPFGSRRTRRPASSGAWRVMGSSSAKRPSWLGVKAAIVVTGLVIDAIRNNRVPLNGQIRHRSQHPTAAVCTTRPFPRHTRVAAAPAELFIYVGSKRGFDGIIIGHG